MADKYQEILRTYWGYPDFRGIQRDIIESIARGEDTLGLMPTGGGKSITFQVPALAQKGVCIVVTPLIALMKDQVQHLKARNILVKPSTQDCRAKRFSEYWKIVFSVKSSFCMFHQNVFLQNCSKLNCATFR